MNNRSDERLKEIREEIANILFSKTGCSDKTLDTMIDNSLAYYIYNLPINDIINQVWSAYSKKYLEA